MPAVRLAAAIRERRITSEHAVTAYIKRIREVNPLLNLVVKDRFVSAIAEAKHVHFARYRFHRHRLCAR